MEKAQSLKYLGEIVHESGKNNYNLLERRAKAYAIFAEIRAILEDVPLGKYRIQTGLQLRQAMFVNGVLFNSKVWHGLNSTDLAMLSVVDHQILRFIIGAHAKTATEFLYLETSALPLSFIVASIRMIYLQDILKRDQKELLRRVYKAQKENPTKGDFVELVKKDFELIEEVIDEIKIETMTQFSYKNLIKSKIRKAAFKHLTALQDTHEKVKYIKYDKFEIQPYMTSPLFSNEEVSNLADLRSHSTRGIRKNFSSWYKPNLTCPLGCPEEDNQSHLYQCGPLQAEQSSEQIEAIRNTRYEDIYGSLEEQKSAIKIISWLLDTRRRLLEAVTPVSGFSLNAAPTPGGDEVHVNVIH